MSTAMEAKVLPSCHGRARLNTGPVLLDDHELVAPGPRRGLCLSAARFRDHSSCAQLRVVAHLFVLLGHSRRPRRDAGAESSLPGSWALRSDDMEWKSNNSTPRVSELLCRSSATIRVVSPADHRFALCRLVFWRPSHRTTATTSTVTIYLCSLLPRTHLSAPVSSAALSLY